MANYDWLSQITGSIQSIATVVAIVVGGVWTYNVFVRERKHAEKGKIAFNQIARVRLPDQKVLLKVVFDFANSAAVKLHPWWAYGSVYPVVHARYPRMYDDQGEPEVDPEALDAPPDGYYEEDGELYFSDSPLDQRQVSYVVNDWTLEPGETETIALDFVIPADVSAVRLRVMVYCGQRTPDNDLRKRLELPDPDDADYTSKIASIDRLLDDKCDWWWESVRLIDLTATHQSQLVPGLVGGSS